MTENGIRAHNSPPLMTKEAPIVRSHRNGPSAEKDYKRSHNKGQSWDFGRQIGMILNTTNINYAEVHLFGQSLLKIHAKGEKKKKKH